MASGANILAFCNTHGVVGLLTSERLESASICHKSRPTSRRTNTGVIRPMYLTLKVTITVTTMSLKFICRISETCGQVESCRQTFNTAIVHPLIKMFTHPYKESYLPPFKNSELLMCCLSFHIIYIKQCDLLILWSIEHEMDRNVQTEKCSL